MKRVVPIAVLISSLAGCMALPPPAPRPAPTPKMAQKAPARPTWRTTPDAPFRQSEPPPDEAPFFVPPIIQKVTLSNGIPVWMMTRRDQGVLSLRIVSTSDPAGCSRAFTGIVAGAAIVATDSDTKQEFGDAFAQDRIGSGYDYVQLGAMMLGSNTDRVFDLLSNLVRKPTYPASSAEWLRGRRQAILEATHDSDEVVAFSVLRQLVHGDHPYGRTLQLTRDEIGKLTHDELLRTHEAVFSPEQITLVAAGDFRTEDLIPKLEKAFGTWKVVRSKKTVSADTLRHEAPRGKAPPAGGGARITVIDRPGSSHAQLVVGSLGPAFASPDFAALDIATDLLGALPNSFIRKRIRDELKLSYDSTLRMPATREQGMLSWSGNIQKERIGEALRELLSASNAMLSSEPAPADLASARERSRQRFVSDLETADQMAESMVMLVSLRADPTEPARYQDKVDAVVSDDVKRVSKAWLDLSRWKAVVVGDWSAMRAQLTGLGWGPIELRDDQGKLLSTVTP